MIKYVLCIHEEVVDLCCKSNILLGSEIIAYSFDDRGTVSSYDVRSLLCCNLNFVNKIALTFQISAFTSPLGFKSSLGPEKPVPKIDKTAVDNHQTSKNSAHLMG